MLYSQEILGEMANKVDLYDYMSRTVDFVKKSGSTYFALCPFHEEKTPSLALDTENGRWYCFGCLKKGNIYNWIQLTENVSFEQAVRKVAELTNTEIINYTESESLAFYKSLKRLNRSTIPVLTDRTLLNIDDDYRQRFADEIPQEWLDEGIPAEIMKKYEVRIDPISNRIVYPVFDNDGNLISVKGRTRFKNYKELNIMKYINYTSLGGRVDYFQGMKQAREFIKQQNEIIIFEGIKSVMKADSWGFHNCVSAETSKLNEYQVELLIQMQIRNVVIAFDKDVDIKKIRSNVDLLKKFTNVYVVYDKWNMLDDKDSPPDKGESVWRTLYERRMRL